VLGELLVRNQLQLA
jgi:hypothetical protein